MDSNSDTNQSGMESVYKSMKTHYHRRDRGIQGRSQGTDKDSDGSKIERKEFEQKLNLKFD